MNYQEIEQAFIKADDLAQKGDKQAFEDAQYFAQILHSRLKEQEPSMLATAGKNLVGGAAAAGDFFANMIPDAISGVGGLATGAFDAATSDRSFLDSAADMTREIQNSPAMSAMRNGLGKLSGTEQSGGYKAATEALEIPAILGKKAIQGWQALGRLPIEGLDSTVNKLQNPEADPLGHVVAEAGGPLLGYPLVGKGARKPFDKLAENTVKSEYKKPEPLDSYKQEESAWPLKPLEPGREWGRTLSDIEYPRKDLKGELKEGEDPTAFYPEGMDQPKKESTIDNLPPLDIDLLPERVSKDTVVKGMVTQWNNTQSRLREIYQKANELGLEGTRVRSGELGTTKKSKTQINSLREQITTLETKLNNIAKQLQRRMEVKHNFVYDEGWEGAPLYSGAKTHLKVDEMGNPVFEQRRVGAGSSGGKMKWTTEEVPKTETETGVFSDVPPSVKGPAERTTGLEVEKSTTPNMQRSPDANVTGAEMVSKTKNHPLGGVGKKQGGAIDPTIFKDLFPEFDLSKFKDELGKLLPLYHGTSKDKAFSDFKNSDRGIWVTDNPKDASSYAFENDSKRIKYNADSGRFEPVNNSPRVHQVYVNAQNIYKPTALEMEQYRTAKSYSKAQAELMKKAKALGYDAIDYGGGVYAIADSSQIKSAISPDVSPKRGLNKGPGGKQSGGVNFGISEKIADLLTKSRTKTTSKPNGKPSGVTANFYEETRDAETFFKEELPNASSWKDIPTNLLNNFLQGRAVANLARHSNPLVRYIVHKTVSADRVAKVSIENALWGDKFIPSMIRGVSKRIKSDNGMLTFLDRAKFKDAEKLKQTLLKFDNSEELVSNKLTRPTEEMLRKEGLSSEQITAANAIYDGIKKVYDEVNKVLKAAGKEEIQALPGYIPHMWFGDYRVVVKDPATKETLDIRGVDTRYQANALKKELAKRYGDKNIEMFDASKNKYKANDLSAFEYATRILSKDSPERKIIEQVYKDVMSHRGFRTHALRRKGTPGFAGSEPGRRGMGDFQKALEVWVNQGYHFIANEKKRALFGDVTDRLSKLEEKPNLENTQKFINEYTQQATGGLENQLKLIDSAVEAAGDLSGFGPSAARKVLGTASGLASFFWLTTTKTLGVNLLQPVYAIPKLLEMKGSLPDTSSVTRAMAQGFMESFVPGTLSSKSRKGLNWARENGFIESKTLELIRSRFNKANLAHDFAYNLSKHTLGVFEQEAVRTPTFIAFDVLLRDTIKDDKQRWQTAGALTDQYMVDYGRTESPLVFSKAGDIVGDSVRPLKQYSASYFGQLAEYAHLASTDKRFAPLAAFLGVQVVLSGLMGIPGFQTANSIIKQLNEGTGSKIKTPEDILLTSGMSDTFIWGPVSKVTGIDISKSVGAPGVEEFITAPGLSFMAGVGKGAINMASEGLSGTLSSADIMKDVGQMIPNPHVQAGIEKANQLPSGHIPDPNNRMLPKYTNPRSDSDMMKRLLTGGQLLKEQEEKAIINSTRGAEQHRSKVKAEIMEKFIDDLVIQRKDKISPELLKEYVAEGGDPRNLSKELTSYLRDSLTGRLEREILNSKGLSQVEKIESLKKYKTIIEGLELEQLMGIVSNE